jgi:hypothetical protein
VEHKLRLEEYKTLHRVLTTAFPFLNGFLRELLFHVEEYAIQHRAVNTVDKAIEEYVKLESIEEVVSMVEPVYTEKPSETSTSLPEMRLTAPWYIEKVE